MGYILAGMADVFFLGRMGVTELAIGTLAIQYHVIWLVLTMGISYALTPLISHLDFYAHHRLIRRHFLHTLFVSLLFSVVFIVSGILLFPVFCNLFDVDPGLVRPSGNFVRLILPSLIPLSVFTTFRMLFESYGDSKTGMIISLKGNALNIVLNFVFIYYWQPLKMEKYYYPALATLLARLYMTGSFYYDLTRHKILHKVLDVFRWEPRWADANRVLRIGIPTAMQFFFEVIAFTGAGFMAASFGKHSLDAHGIVLQMASFTYMFGSGISNASCVLAGKYFYHPEQRQNSWKIPLKLTAILMLFFAVIFFAGRKFLPRIFNDDPMVLCYASDLLIFASVFQLADGIQVVSAGILRGIKIIRYPTLVILFSYSVVGLGGSYLLGKIFDVRVYGIWFSLSVSLVLVAILLWIKCRKAYR